MLLIDFPENTVSYVTKVDAFSESSAKHQKITFYLILKLFFGHVRQKLFVSGQTFFCCYILIFGVVGGENWS